MRVYLIRASGSTEAKKGNLFIVKYTDFIHFVVVSPFRLCANDCDKNTHLFTTDFYYYYCCCYCYWHYYYCCYCYYYYYYYYYCLCMNPLWSEVNK